METVITLALMALVLLATAHILNNSTTTDNFTDDIDAECDTNYSE